MQYRKSMKNHQNGYILFVNFIDYLQKQRISEYSIPDSLRLKISSIIRMDKQNLEKATEELRQLGIKCMAANQYAKAYDVYRTVLGMTTDPLLREKFYLNKAIVCSKLNLYLEYGENINQVLKLNPTGQKAVYHQIKQLILTGKFKEASEAIKDKFSVLGEANTKQLLKMLELERSFRMNKIDWYKALKFQELGQFTSPSIRVGKGSFGLGVIATRNIQPGELILVERPLLWSEKKGGPQQRDSLTTANKTAIKLGIKILHEHSWEFRDRAKNLCSCQRLKQIGDKQRTLPPKLSGKEMEGIIDTNGFELIQFKDLLKMQGLPDSELRLGLFELMSMFNHCCEANCLRFSVGPSMVVYALREIREGDELFISYFKMMSVDGRRNTLKNWGIDCRCVLCEQQLYEKKNGQVRKGSKSKEQKIYKIMERMFLEENQADMKEISVSYDVTLLQCLIYFRQKVEMAAEILRRVLPMTEKESLELVHKPKEELKGVEEFLSSLKQMKGLQPGGGLNPFQ